MSLEAVKKELTNQREKLLKEASQIGQALSFLGVTISGGEVKRGRRLGSKLSPEAIEKIRVAAKKHWAIKKKALSSKKGT